MHRTRWMFPLGLLAAVTLRAGAGEAARFDFESEGDPEGWETFRASLRVSGGVLAGVARGPDPQLARDAVERAPDAAWDTLTIKVRELDHLGGPVPYADAGLLLIFNVQDRGSATNFGPPRTVSDPDAAGFRTLAWDLSGFAPASTGRIRLDPIGGPDTVRPDAPDNGFEVDSIVFYDTSDTPR